MSEFSEKGFFWGGAEGGNRSCEGEVGSFWSGHVYSMKGGAAAFESGLLGLLHQHIHYFFYLRFCPVFLTRALDFGDVPGNG